MAIAFYTAVSFLLLLAVSGIFEADSNFLRLGAAAFLAGLYSYGCCLRGFTFLGHLQWYISCMAAVATVAFGAELATLGMGAAFLVLHMAVGAVARALNGGIGAWLGLCLLLASCRLLPRCRRRTVEVVLRRGQTQLRLTALRDSGNLLRDPISGKPVLVAGPEAARAFANLTPAQLQSPVELMGKVPGLRLVPYKTVGGAGLLAAMELPQVTVEGESQSLVVAFSPQVLDAAGRYQALIGGYYA